MVVKLPGNDVRSKMKINWLNEFMRTEYITLNHALNCHRLSACEMYVPIQHSLNLMSLFLTENTHLLIILLVRSEQQKSTRVLCMLQFSRKS